MALKLSIFVMFLCVLFRFGMVCQAYGNITGSTVSPLRRVLLLGDSNIFGTLGKQVEHAIRLHGYEVIRFGKPTSGMARPDFFDWTQAGPELVHKYRPDIVIIMFGGNDGQRLAPYLSAGRWIPWDREKQWRAEYGARIVQLAQLLRGSGRQVWFLSPTNRRPSKAREKMRRIMDVQRDVLRNLKDVRWLDVFSLSSDETGAYLSRVPTSHGRWVPARRRDGIHLTEEGGRVVSERIVGQLTRNFHELDAATTADLRASSGTGDLFCPRYGTALLPGKNGSPSPNLSAFRHCRPQACEKSGLGLGLTCPGGN